MQETHICGSQLVDAANAYSRTTDDTIVRRSRMKFIMISTPSRDVPHHGTSSQFRPAKSLISRSTTIHGRRSIEEGAVEP